MVPGKEGLEEGSVVFENCGRGEEMGGAAAAEVVSHAVGGEGAELDGFEACEQGEGAGFTEGDNGFGGKRAAGKFVDGIDFRVVERGKFGVCEEGTVLRELGGEEGSGNGADEPMGSAGGGQRRMEGCEDAGHHPGPEGNEKANGVTERPYNQYGAITDGEGGPTLWTAAEGDDSAGDQEEVEDCRGSQTASGKLCDGERILDEVAAQVDPVKEAGKLAAVGAAAEEASEDGEREKGEGAGQEGFGGEAPVSPERIEQERGNENEADGAGGGGEGDEEAAEQRLPKERVPMGSPVFGDEEGQAEDEQEGEIAVDVVGLLPENERTEHANGGGDGRGWREEGAEHVGRGDGGGEKQGEHEGLVSKEIEAAPINDGSEEQRQDRGITGGGRGNGQRLSGEDGMIGAAVEEIASVLEVDGTVVAPAVDGREPAEVKQAHEENGGEKEHRPRAQAGWANRWHKLSPRH